MERTQSTKDKIIESSINLFAKRGFNDVSVREIGREVGIKESSIYNHFKSKNAILDEIFNSFSNNISKYTVPVHNAVECISHCTYETFVELSKNSFMNYIGSPVMIKIWKILAIERFRNETANKFFKETLIDSAIEYQTEVFKLLMEKGVIHKQLNPHQLAVEFHSFNIFLYFRYIDLEKIEAIEKLIPKILEMLENHIGIFIKTIGYRFSDYNF